MSKENLSIETPQPASEHVLDKVQPAQKLAWETPRLEDVSEQVMAQPYIRFT